MKDETILLLIIGLLLFSCTRDNNSLSVTDDEGYITYSITGNVTKYQGNYATLNASGEGVYMIKVLANLPAIPQTLYRINGQRGANNAITLNVVTDSLRIQNYLTSFPPPANTILVINGKTYSTYHPTRPAQITINVSSHAGGKVSGTFSGKFFFLDINQTVPTDSVVLTGEFKKVQVMY